MNFIYCKKFNISSLFIVGVGVLLASAFLFFFIAQAQTDADHEAQIQAAIEDLSSVTGQNITSEDQAKNFCNQEQYMDVCADIGKKHDLYTSEEAKQVDDFLIEVKGKILDDIKTCPDEECLIKVANELANKIKTKNPTLATDLNLTTKIVAEKQAVIQAAKEVGVNFQDCESMDPDTAPIDLLRKCAKLAKDSRVQKYIPETKRVLIDQFSDTTLVLREGLTSGKYQCGDNTLEGCGNYCLNPSVASIGAGIPEVCKQIATEVFGSDGVKQLESAHQQVSQVRDYYSKKFILTLPDGSELVGEGQIRNACDRAFSGRKLDIAKACGAFAVQNGFASQAEVNKGLKLMESFVNKGQNVNFDECLANPAACRDFIPEDERERFDVGNQIFQIMKEEIGFEPFQCERGALDEAIGTKCFEGSKKALARIESLGLTSQSREAGFIVEDIKRHVAEGENFMQRKDQFKQVFEQQGGPGGCKSEAECFTYCSNPTNGPECISFGAQQGVSGFRGQEAIQRFQDYNQNIQKPGFITSDEYRPYPPGGQYPGQGPYPYPGLPPGGDVIYPPGQDPRFTQPGPGFNPPPGIAPYYPPPYPGGPGPVGPSPECFAAIQSGDFVRAKTVCYVPSPTQPFSTPPICPASPYVQCPAGEYKESYRNNEGCWIDGPCKPAPTYSPGPYPSYTQYPGDQNSCPSFSHSKWDNTGKRYCRLNEANSCQYNYPAYLERSNYAVSNCPSGDNNVYPTYSPYLPPGVSYTPAPPCPPGQWWDYAYNQCTSATPQPYPTYSLGPGSGSCSQSLINLLGQGCHQMYTDSSGKLVFCDGPMSKSAKEGDAATTAGCSGGGATYSPYPTYSSGPGGGTCSQSLINLLGTGCHWMYSDSAGRGIFCDGPMSKSAKEGDAATTAGCSGGGATYSPYPSYSPPVGTGNCPSGYHYHGESGGFCMNDQENYGGTCYNASGTSTITCPVQASSTPYPTYSPTSGGSCPSGSHTMYVNNAGGYCMSDSDGSKCGSLNSTSVSSFGSCSSYQTTTSYTPYPSCPSGQWWDTATSRCTSTTTSCGSGYYWDSASNICKPSGGTSYTPYPSCPSGQWWDTATSSCKSGTSTYTPAPSCPAGQWWDYTTNSCKSSTVTGYCGNYVCDSGETSTTCPTDCGGGVSYSPYPTTSYTPYPTVTFCGPGYYWDSTSNSCKSTCPSTQYWNGSACVDNVTTTYTPPPITYTPYPTTEYTPPPYSPPPAESYSPPPPPPTSSLYPHYMIAHCQQLGRTWNGDICRANGLFARIYESYTSDFATILKAFGF